MKITSNLPEFINNLQRIRDVVANGGGVPGSGTNFSDAVGAAINEGRGRMLRRIFNENFDANGESLGKYIGRTTAITGRKHRILKYGDTDASARGKKKLRKNLKGNIGNGFNYTEYEKERLAHGRQIGKKDLEFSGSLRRSIETVKSYNKAAIVINNAQNALIAGYQQRQVGNIRATGFAKGSAKPAPIFQLSKEEFETVRKEGNERLTDMLIKIFKNN